MSARENILNRIRAKLGKTDAAKKTELEAAQSYIREHAQHVRPSIDWPDLVGKFRQEAEALASSVDEVETLAEVPAAVARYLGERQLDRRGVCWAEFSALDWNAAGVAMEARPVREDDALGLTGAFCAIAETGTLMLLSGRETAAATSLLPDTHIAIVRCARIVPAMEEAWNLLRHQRGALANSGSESPPIQPSVWPRAVNFVSGPSRSGDIEMNIVLGVHGPYRVHIILVRESDASARELINTDWWRRPAGGN